MGKKRSQPKEVIAKQLVKSVCIGFAFSCPFLSFSVTFCPPGRGPNRLKTLERQEDRRPLPSSS